MGSAQITEALASLSQSSRILSSLSFAPLAVLPQTVLSSEDAFETHLIRDAAPHELALFEPNDPTNDPVIAVDAFEGAGIEGERWVCLRAAKKLLDVYTMPRAQEHVEALHSQWAGIIDTISSLEDTLRRPPSRSAPQPSHDSSYFRQLELEDLIKREKLEVFALEQLKAEKEAELALLSPLCTLHIRIVHTPRHRTGRQTYPPRPLSRRPRPRRSRAALLHLSTLSL
ncbi:hypothetical protein BJY59DRAFT_70716 [Rhodotorula toruloides]